jgi:hypothetical protein
MGWWDQQLQIHCDILTRAAEVQRNVDENSTTTIMLLNAERSASRTGVPTTYAINSYVVVEYPKTVGEAVK